MSNDIDLIGRSLEDVIIEPVRSILIPVLMKLKQNAKRWRSGRRHLASGHSIFMLSKNEVTAKEVGNIMRGVWKIGIENFVYVTTINKKVWSSDS